MVPPLRCWTGKRTIAMEVVSLCKARVSFQAVLEGVQADADGAL